MTKGQLIDRLMTLVKKKTELFSLKVAAYKATDFRLLESKGAAEALSDYNCELLDIIEAVVKEEQEAERLEKESRDKWLEENKGRFPGADR